MHCAARKKTTTNNAFGYQQLHIDCPVPRAAFIFFSIYLKKAAIYVCGRKQRYIVGTLFTASSKDSSQKDEICNPAKESPQLVGTHPRWDVLIFPRVQQQYATWTANDTGYLVVYCCCTP